MRSRLVGIVMDEVTGRAYPRDAGVPSKGRTEVGKRSECNLRGDVAIGYYGAPSVAVVVTVLVMTLNVVKLCGESDVVIVRIE
ncbi:unnamed protein product [Merluccius merluccius]